MSANQKVGGQVLGPGDGKRIQFATSGFDLVFKAWGKRRSGDHDVAEFLLPPGFRGPGPHVHRKHEELFYVLQGEVEFLVGEQSVLLRPGSLALVAPGNVHDFRNSGSAKARLLFISSPAGLDSYFEELAALSTSGTSNESNVKEPVSYTHLTLPTICSV